jgi:hypothetical protein
MFSINNSVIANLQSEISFWEAKMMEAHSKGQDCSFESERLGYWLEALREEENKAKNASHRMEVARIIGAMFLMVAIFITVVGGGSLISRSLIEANQPQVAEVK